MEFCVAEMLRKSVIILSTVIIQIYNNAHPSASLFIYFSFAFSSNEIIYVIKTRQSNIIKHLWTQKNYNDNNTNIIEKYTNVFSMEFVLTEMFK